MDYQVSALSPEDARSIERHLSADYGPEQCRAPSLCGRTTSRRTRKPYQRRGDGANERLRDQHARIIPIAAILVALIFVSVSDLTQDQRQALTSLMAHRNRVLADYRLNELREVCLAIFCTTKTSVDNPLLAPSSHGGPRENIGWTLDIALSDHLEEFRPLQSKELHDTLETLPHHLASCFATQMWEYLRGMQAAWRWFYVRNYDLQQYFRTLRHVLRHYPPTSRLSQFPETTAPGSQILGFLVRGHHLPF